MLATVVVDVMLRECSWCILGLSKNNLKRSSVLVMVYIYVPLNEDFAKFIELPEDVMR